MNSENTVQNLTRIYFNSGNTLNWNRLKGQQKNVLLTSSNEFLQVFTHTLTNFLSKDLTQTLDNGTELVYRNNNIQEIFSRESKDSLKLSAKIFLFSFDENSLRKAIDAVLNDLNVTEIDTLICCIPEKDEEVCLNDLKPFWEVIESYCKNKIIKSAGIADLSKEVLEDLYNWATTKPTITQIHLAECCVMPPELREFAKLNNILLLTHNDAPSLVDVDQFQTNIANSLSTLDGINWKPQYIARYMVSVTCQSVIQSKGYISEIIKTI